MAKYAAVVKGGLFAQYSSGLGSIDVYNSAKDHRRLAQELSKKKNMEIRAILNSIVVGGLGQNATANYYEIAAAEELGGLRPIVNRPLVNRTTVASDTVDIQETIGSLSSDTYTISPVYNGDRNPLGTR
jgi:hypothetical protein